MAKNIWDNEEPFRDGAPVFENGSWKEAETYTPAPENTLKQNHVQPVQSTQQEEDIDIEGLTEEVAEEDEEDYTEVLSDARIRLEQGKLYEMIMQHDLFADVDADPRAAKSVQKQIRKFAKERMEIMLGIRSEPSEQLGSIVSSPFNDLEVVILKKLASAASKGATESEAMNVSSPVVQTPKKKTLNSIGSNKSKLQQKSFQKKTEPLQRQKIKSNLPPEFEPDYKPLDKPIEKMTASELEERNRQTADRQKNRNSAMPVDKIPMPDYATMEMLAASQVSKATGAGNLATSLNGKLSSLIISNSIKKV